MGELPRYKLDKRAAEVKFEWRATTPGPGPRKAEHFGELFEDCCRVWWRLPVILAPWEAEVGGPQVRSHGDFMRPCFKIRFKKGGGRGRGWMVERPGSVPSTAEKVTPG